MLTLRTPMLTASEYHMRGLLPIYRIQEAIFDFCRDRPDIGSCGGRSLRQTSSRFLVQNDAS